MDLELITSYSYNVASLVAGIGVDFLPVLEFGHSSSLPINLLPVELGIAAVDRLYPLKPKNPI
ncbi:hypothetical protein [Algoriphagus persicinus]|uniref:hypothetical protein n=1 Tax=Algoriphagus persicinus TaxID=3108754 RepID=UPI002B3F103E|nr:hypothetical protein [Algoriphagus sp. E1-3-M2]MEB2786821.1 hypothetical protein [Algoriphagus sp. E1-3-M2]